MLDALLAQRRPGEAVGLAEQLLAIEPANAELCALCGLAFEAAGQIDRATTQFRACLEQAPGHVTASVRLAQMLSTEGDFPGALALIKDAAKRVHGNPQLHHLAGQLHESMQQHDAAARHHGELARLRPQKGAFELAGKAAMAAGDIKTARRAFKSAMQHGSRPEHILATLARLEAGHGDANAAVAHLNSALRQAPEDGFAYLQLAADFASHVDTAALLVRAKSAKPMSPGGEPLEARDIPMCFAYARLHELTGDTDTAFGFYQRGNASLQAASQYDPACETAFADAIIEQYQGIAHELDTAEPAQDAAPVFIFGLPRSGTSLLEQIFSAHPQIAGIGEHEAFGWIARYIASGETGRLAVARENYLASYPAHARKALRVVDKSMSTPEHIGTILRVFPKAHLIHCTRHPMETAWSMYTMYFGDRRVSYSNSFSGIAARTAAIGRLMDFWQEKLPGRIHSVRYDDLVADMEGTATAALEHAGMTWHEDCAAFHEAKTMVRTASITQVRQPVYTTASQKWRRYERHLQPLNDLLTPLIERYETEANTRQPRA